MAKYNWNVLLGTRDKPTVPDNTVSCVFALQSFQQCNILRWAYHEELHHLLVRVNSVVALNFASATGQERSNNKKQMPQIQTQLTKLVYLKSREDPSVDPRDPG